MYSTIYCIPVGLSRRVFFMNIKVRPTYQITFHLLGTQCFYFSNNAWTCSLFGHETVDCWWRRLMMTAAAAVCQLWNLPLSLNESIQLIDRSASEASGYVQTLIKVLSSSRLSDKLHHRCPPALTRICLHQVALSGTLAAVIIADVFLPSISFPQSRQSAAGGVVGEERSTQTLSGLIWCLQQEMKTAYLTGWRVGRRWRWFIQNIEGLKWTPDKTVTTNSVNLPANMETVVQLTCKELKTLWGSLRLFNRNQLLVSFAIKTPPDSITVFSAGVKEAEGTIHKITKTALNPQKRHSWL